MTCFPFGEGDVRARARIMFELERPVGDCVQEMQSAYCTCVNDEFVCDAWEPNNFEHSSCAPGCGNLSHGDKWLTQRKCVTCDCFRGWECVQGVHDPFTEWCSGAGDHTVPFLSTSCIHGCHEPEALSSGSDAIGVIIAASCLLLFAGGVLLWCGWRRVWVLCKRTEDRSSNHTEGK